MEPEKIIYTLKFVGLGEGGVGKTSCINMYTDGIFSEKYKATIGTTFSVKTVTITIADGTEIRTRTVLSDLAGQPAYNELRNRYMSGSSAGFIVFDVTRPATFMNVLGWFTKFMTVCPDAAVALVGNKVDKEGRLVPIEAGEMAAKMLGVPYFETSAKTGKNIETMFTHLVGKAIEQRRKEGNI